MSRIAILPYGPSNSCGVLRDALRTALRGLVDDNVVLLRSGGNTTFRGRQGDIVINYGNRSANAEVFGQATVLNTQASLNNAANKLNALNSLTAAGVSVVPYTTDRTVAMQWANEANTLVYARTVLNGHSGEGIVVQRAEDVGPLFAQAPLYTKGITGQRREWRVHVFDGVITHVQVKRRRNGYQDDPAYREDVRNHSTGWIYATENINPSDAVLRNAVNAVAALGLNFGAVDIISRNFDAWVLEVNTAPGLQADTTLDAFVSAIVAQVTAIRSGQPAQITARFQTPAPVVPPAPEPLQEMTPEEAPAVPRSRPVPQAETSVRSSNQSAPQVMENREDGYYVGEVLLADGSAYQGDVILWVSNGLAYRHGWNAPLSSREVRGLVKLSSVATVRNNTIQVL